MNAYKYFAKQIPNILTLTRIGLIAPFLLYFIAENYTSAFYIFVMAGLTDGLDGWLARYCHWKTALGAFLDPLADKLIVAISFVALACVHQLPWWLVILVFMRDVTIASGMLYWVFFIRSPLVIAPTMLSKVNTTLQLLLVVCSLFELAYTRVWAPVTFFILVLTAMTTFMSYVHYVWVWGNKACLLHRIKTSGKKNI